MLKSFNLIKIYCLCFVLFCLTLLVVYLHTDPVPTNGVLKSNIEVSFNYIFFNNLKVVLLLIFLAPLTFGIGTIIVLIINGLMLGSFLGSIKNDFSLSFLLIPHGIIELPILLLAASVGIKLTLDLFSMKIQFKVFFKQLVIILFGLLIAASIESFITPMFLEGVIK
ncbi:stage II sporulation protein M [Bacillus thuringiensis]|uniref:stage II sporulation protein M n=1 Tax=Bacillus thuringiensis TaxID=1428 RepID=UPI00136F29A9|nr:stage II sporulation protein M [Bacillus thuringiensis]MED2879966.1 stage II sporulation protein M [Bacillus thuringiensis]MYW24751.1 stage II sporulation protein M [Bacillus thuringiensis]MYW24765.1 stage II sporulation protein M [Bacillus thuringiensis]